MSDNPGTAQAPDAPRPQVLEKSRPRNERMSADKIECNACPVLCQISAGKVGACDRYANQAGVLVRLDPVLILERGLAGNAAAPDAAAVPFLDAPADPGTGG